jgi:hypothetical protein
LQYESDSAVFKAASDKVQEIFGNFAGVGELVFDNFPDLGIGGNSRRGGDIYHYLYGLLAV